MSVKTKENKDAYQDFSAMKKKSLKPIIGEYKKNKKSRHNLLDYPSPENMGSKDSICVEGTATNIRSIKTMNFISTPDNRRFNTQVTSKLIYPEITNSICIGNDSKNRDNNFEVVKNEIRYTTYN